MSVEQSNTVSLPLTGSPSFTPVWIPMNFPYLTAFLHGRPRHDRDDFSYKHPQMDHGKRAKIFAPFDALDGYSDAVRSKDIEYVQKIDLTEDTLAEEERDELSRRLEILHRLTFNGSLARKNRMQVSVKHYVPCTDENSFSYGIRGVYKVVTGVCRKVDPVGQTMTVGQTVIPFGDIVGIDGADGALD